MLWSYYLVQVWGFLEVIIWSKFVFSKTPIANKHYKSSGFSTFFWKQIGAHKILEVIIWSWSLTVQVGVFLKRTQLGPDNNFQLGPDNNFQKCTFLFVIFCFLKMCQNTYFSAFFENQVKLAKCQNNDNFFTFCKTQVDKKNRYVATPPLDPKLVFLTLHFFKEKH